MDFGLEGRFLKLVFNFIFLTTRFISKNCICGTIFAVKTQFIKRSTRDT